MISIKYHLFDLLRGLHSLIFTRSPILEELFSS